MKYHGCYLSLLKHQKLSDERHFLAVEDIDSVSEDVEVIDQAEGGGEDLEGQGHLKAVSHVHL